MKTYLSFFFLFSIFTSTFASSISETGLISNRSATIIKSLSAGKVSFMLDDYSNVKKGDLLFSINVDDHLKNLEEAEESLEEKEKNYEEHALNLEDILVRNKLQIEILEKELLVEKFIYKDELSKPYSHEVRKIELQMKLNKINLERSDEKLRRQKELITQGFAKQGSLKKFELQVKNFKAARENQKLELQILKEGILNERKVELEVKLKKIENEIQQLKMKAENEKKRIQANMKITMHKIFHTKKKIKNLKDFIANQHCHAPTEGIWKINQYRDWGRGGKWFSYNTGVDSYKNLRVGQIINPNNMMLEVLLHEVDIKKIKLNTLCKVYIPALKNKEYQATITKISKLARDKLDLAMAGTENNPSRFGLFKTLLEFKQISSDFKLGMSARVIIPLEGEAVND